MFLAYFTYLTCKCKINLKENLNNLTIWKLLKQTFVFFMKHENNIIS